jgi:hypothetical protein
MSTNVRNFVIVGFDIGYEYVKKFNNDVGDDDAFYDKYEEFYYSKKSKENDFIIVYDGMSGNYCIIGMLIDYGDDYNSVNVNLSVKELSNLCKKSKTLIKKQFDMDVEPSLHIFTHYS